MTKLRTVIPSKRPQPGAATSGSIASKDTPLPISKKPKISKHLPRSADRVSAISGSDSRIQTIESSAVDVAADEGSKKTSKASIKHKPLKAHTEDESNSKEGEADFDDYDVEGIPKIYLRLWSQSAPDDQKLQPKAATRQAARRETYDSTDSTDDESSCDEGEIDFDDYDTGGMTKEQFLLCCQHAPPDQKLRTPKQPKLQTLSRATHEDDVSEVFFEDLLDTVDSLKEPPQLLGYGLTRSNDKDMACQPAANDAVTAKNSKRSALASNTAEGDMKRKAKKKKKKKGKNSDKAPGSLTIHPHVGQPSAESPASLNHPILQASEKSHGQVDKPVKLEIDPTEKKANRKRLKKNRRGQRRSESLNYDVVNPKGHGAAEEENIQEVLQPSQLIDQGEPQQPQTTTLSSVSARPFSNPDSIDIPIPFSSSPLSSAPSSPILPPSPLPPFRYDFCSVGALSTPPSTPSKSDLPSPSKQRKSYPKISPYFPTPPRASRPRKAPVSCIPFPPVSASRFGIIQETLAHDPFALLIAVIFLNKTRGAVAIPVFYRLCSQYPTAETLAEAQYEDVVSVFSCLGLQNQRAKKVIGLAKAWVADPPARGRRWRRLNYPCKGDGADIKSCEGPIGDEEDDGRVAWEVGNLPGVGSYAIDSWRIFCRDELRGKANGLPAFDELGENVGDGQEGGLMDAGGGVREEELQKEWTRVLPLDKELRAYLRWRWLRLGWVWDSITGERTLATPNMMREAEKGGVIVEEDGQATKVETSQAFGNETVKVGILETGEIEA